MWSKHVQVLVLRVNVRFSSCCVTFGLLNDTFGEDPVGLSDLLELLLGAGFFVLVRVVLARHLPVGLLDFVGGGRARDAEDGVVILAHHLGS